VPALFIVFATAAQQGSPFLTHFFESREIENQSWSICQDEDQLMLFANRKGISVFDGIAWNSLRIATIPYTLEKNPFDKRIYIGGDNNFGYLEKGERENYRYVSLSGDSAKTGVITNIVFSKGIAWFCSDQSLVRYDLDKGKQDLILTSGAGSPFTGMFISFGNTFINVLNKGLYRLESDTLFPLVTGYITEKTNILFSLPYDNKLVLTGRSDGTLALFDGIKYYDYNIKDDGYLRQNILSEGISLGDTAYAFSTLDGGVLVAQKYSGKVLYTINNQAELPDDEIYALGCDVSGGLWMSHQYGLSRADLCLPVENYSIFPGLKGNLSAALRYGNELYVATSEGVYYLEEVKNYDEVEVMVKSVSSASSAKEPAAVEAPKEQQSSRTNIFSRIFGKKNETLKESPVIETGQKKKTIENTKPVVRYTRKTISRLKSINFVYKKVDGLNEKCRQLVRTTDGILSATNKGLYVIKDHKALPVIPGKYITYIRWQPFDGYYYIATSEGCWFVSCFQGEWKSQALDQTFVDPIYSVSRENSNTLWLGGDNLIFRVDLGENQSARGYINYKIKKDYPDRYLLRFINDTLFLFTESEVHFYNKTEDRFDPYISRTAFVNGRNYLMPLSNFPVIRQDGKWVSLETVRVLDDRELSLFRLFDDLVFAGVEYDKIWIIDGRNRLFGIDRKRSSESGSEINILVKSIKNDRGVSFDLDDIKFDRGDNVIHFEIVAPGYLKENTTQYQYFIFKVMPEWSEWSENTRYEKAISKPGDYVLQIRAKDIWGNISSVKSVRFTITAPFTRTLLFYILIAVTGLSLIIFIIRFREKQLQLQNRILEEKVRVRTAELAAQKQEITASIEYAGRIQLAMLPMEKHFRGSFSDYFIYFKPRDIVSGDFYWIGEDEKAIFFTVADCTGHGVPGAFMSTMGISTLNEIIANNHDLHANTVLELLRNKTMRALHQTGMVGEAADGMDVAFCVLDKNRNVLQFSGAFNPLIIFQGGEFREFRADRMPIGIHYGGEKPFTNHVINVNRGDTLYIFSDGYTDQFGGEEGVKFKMAKFRNLLREIYYRPMIEQRNILENEFMKWKGNSDQVDDITILGIRI